MEDTQHGSGGKRKVGAQRRLVAFFLLALSSWSTLASLGIGIIGLTVPRPAEAQISGWDRFVFPALAGPGGAARAQRGEFSQSAVQRFLGAGGVFGSGNPPPSSDGGGLGGGDGLLGGLFGRLFENPALLALLVILLTQLFQGGATPQTGPAEEQPPIFTPDIGPQRTGPRDGVPPAAPVLPGTILPPAAIPAMTLQSSGELSPNTVSAVIGSAVDVNNATTNASTIMVRRAGQTASLAEVSVAADSSHRFRFSTAGTFELVTGTQILGTVTVQ